MTIRLNVNEVYYYGEIKPRPRVAAATPIFKFDAFTFDLFTFEAVLIFSFSVNMRERTVKATFYTKIRVINIYFLYCMTAWNIAISSIALFLVLLNYLIFYFHY